MTDSAYSLSEAVERLGRRDSTLDTIYLDDKQLNDSELAELADCLLAHPDVVTRLWLGNNQMTDATGIKLARYLAASSTIQTGDSFEQPARLGDVSGAGGGAAHQLLAVALVYERQPGSGQFASTRRSWRRCGSIPSVHLSRGGGCTHLTPPTSTSRG